MFVVLTLMRKSILLVTMTEMNIYRSLGQAVAKRRGELGMTQAEVAAQIGLARASLANIETGRQKVMLHHVYRLANVLKLESILDLLPSSFAFDSPAEPLSFGGSEVTPSEKAQLENVIRLALASERSTGKR
jgi:transcriptional regulator with XRE-family HTH domain